MSKTDEMLHFLDFEIQDSKDKLDEPYLRMYDGIDVTDELARRLNISHIRFCNNLKAIINRGE